jgi:flagellar motor switch protein FliM
VARLGTARITLRDILAMKPGDVIPLTIPDTIQAEVDGIPVVECHYGIQRGQYALKIERFIAQEEDFLNKG